MDHRRIIQDSLDYIEQNLKAPITSRELADRAGYSLFHYYRVFQSAAGMSVMQYILRRKLLHAIYDISQGSKRIDTVLSYGFQTYSGFYKAFQREFGCTPSDYLKKHRIRQPWRLNLYKEEHMEITHKKAKEILKFWNLVQEPLSDIHHESNDSRQENALYVGEQYVLKYTPNLGKVQKSIELANALHNAGLNAPIAVPTTDGNSYIQDGPLYFFLTKRLSGKSLSIRELYRGANARFVGQIIGQLHLALQEIDAVVNEADLLEALSTWAIPKAKEALNLPASLCNNILFALDALPKQIIHRDPNPGNIILDGEKWGFVDFELSERNIRIYDPCYAATAILSESFSHGYAEQWLPIYRNILAGYDSIVPLTDAERQAVPYVILANQLVCVAWFSEQEKYAELFETNKVMTRWLVDNFDQLQLKN